METMENQQITAEERERQQRHEAAMKLLKIMETSPLDEALHFACALLAYLLLRCRVEPCGRDWNQFFRILAIEVEDRVNALDAVLSPMIH